MMKLLKDQRKYDIYILQRENQKLLRKLQTYEHGGMGGGGAAGPMSGDVKSLQQKIMYFEKTVKNLEKERS